MQWYKRLSIGKKLVFIAMAAILPMLFLVCYLLWELMDTSEAYTEINHNISYANEYVINFKARIDYTMYYEVISNRTVTDGDSQIKVNGVTLAEPHGYIQELSDVCTSLADSATVNSAKYQMLRVKNSVNSLEDCIETLEKNIVGEGTYDENMQFLDNNIYTLTALIQTGIQDYINEETTNYDNIKAQVDARNQKMIRLTIIITCLVVILAVFLTFRASRSVTVPIRKLCAMTDRVAGGDFTVEEKVEAGDEITALTQNFNDMTQEIGNLVEDIRQQHETLHEIETKLLQAQINPHFLYNTLDTVVWLAEEGKTDQVIAIVTYLSDFFRTTLSNGRDFITIAEEKLHVESYLKIQEFRYQDVLSYEIRIEDDILDFVVPKLLLQPLAENALVHGIRNKRGKGKLLIEGYRDGQMIIFRVADNGKGMSKTELDRLRSCIESGKNNATDNGGFGIVNVNQRIQTYYGSDCGVSFESAPGEGTTATVRIKTKFLSNEFGQP